ncbi:MAG: glucose-1-phosphate adenylyltransferase [Acidobacteria bacterium]|nr:glucose-1-phosphate adenylyltransferase [Acidobacteriota bacterium]
MARKDEVLAIVLGGGQGTRLFPLTGMRSKPAVPLAGKYRLIDVAVSNCINSDIIKIYVLTQFNSASLNRHISRTYRFSRFTEGFIDILAAEQTLDNRDWFQGTADAVRQNWRHFEQWNLKTFLILAGDHLYRMNYRDFVRHHQETKADVTISVIACTEEEASGFGLLKIDSAGRMVEFREKPKGADLQRMRVDTSVIGLSREEAERRPYLASMGIYVFNPQVLYDLLLSDRSKVDFGKEVIPSAIGKYQVQAFLFNGYWQDIGTIKSFYQANMDLTMLMPKFNLYDPEAPIYTRPRFLPPAKIRECRVHDSLIAEGSILSGAELIHCIVGIRTRISTNVRVERSIIMGADFYQTTEETEADYRRGLPPVGLGQDSVIKTAIIDKNARIGRGVRILNEEDRQEFDSENCYIRDGIVIIPKNAALPDGFVI